MPAATPNWNRIQAAHLRDDTALRHLYVQAVQRGEAPGGQDPVLRFWCYAEKALADDTEGTPGRLFRWLCQHDPHEKITNAQEDKAQRRIHSSDRYDVNQAAQAAIRNEPLPSNHQFSLHSSRYATLESDDVGFLHSILAQCYLPQKRLPLDTPRYETRHGLVSLSVTPGQTLGEDGWEPLPIPWGLDGRLILIYITAIVTRYNTRNVYMGRSFRHFAECVGVPYGGKTARRIREQFEAVAAAQIWLGEYESGGQKNWRRGVVANRYGLWTKQDCSRPHRWIQELEVSAEYYQALQNHKMPINLGHIRELRRSPALVDLYLFLSYRTHAARAGKPNRIPLRSLRPNLGPDIAAHHFRLFKHRVKSHLRTLSEVHDFRVEINGDILVLDRSTPPVTPSSNHRIHLL